MQDTPALAPTLRTPRKNNPEKTRQAILAAAGDGDGHPRPGKGLDRAKLLGALLAFKKGDFGVRLPVDLEGVDGKIAGDLADDVWDTAGWVSPNPGGVGPMTRAMLLSNIVDMAEQTAR